MTTPATYDEVEKHESAGSPVELYEFLQGNDFWLYTSAESPVTDYSDTWQPIAISRSEIEQSQEERTGSLDITVPQDNPIAQKFVGSVPVDPISINIYRLHRFLDMSDPDFEVVIFVGKVSAVTFTDGVAKIACLPISAVLRKSIPWPVYQSQCNWALYGPQCGLTASSYSTVVTVDSINIPASTDPEGTVVGASEIAALGDNYFTGGFARRTLNGDIKWIVANIGAYVSLMSAFANPPLEVGEELTLYAGCDRKHTTCLSKFSNLDNFMGFPFVPLKNPYVGSIV